MTTATKIRDGLLRGDAVLWQLSKPVNYGYSWDDEEDRGATEYGITSRVANGWAVETYIFPANAEGEVIDWSEMDGSVRGPASHETVIANAGWTVAA
jgi:hypothetical protein